MFGSKSSRPTTGSATVISNGAVIVGSVRAAGPLRLDGRVEGAVIAEGDAAIGDTGAVLGDVVADELIVQGTVEGTVNVRDDLHLGSHACIRGDVRYGTLQVDRGGVIAGSAVRGEDVITIEVDEREPTVPQVIIDVEDNEPVVSEVAAT